jgi:signal transduction histidine kinase
MPLSAPVLAPTAPDTLEDATARREWLAGPFARWVRLALWPLGVAAGIGAVWSAASDASVRDLGVDGTLYLVVGWSFMASGLVAWTRRPSNRLGPMLVVSGYLWFAGGLLTQFTSSLVFTTGIAVQDAFVVLLVYVMFAFPSGRVSQTLDWLLVAVFAFLMIPMEIAWLLFRPAPEGEPANAFLVWESEGVAHALDTTQRAILIGASCVVAAVVTVRWLRAAAPLRRALVPVLIGGAVLLVAAAMLALEWITDERSQLLQRAVFVALGLVPIAFLLGLLQSRLARSGVAQLMRELGGLQGPGALRDALARALRDPSLELAYWIPEQQRYVAEDGRSAELPEPGSGRTATVVERRGEPVAALLRDEALDEPELVEAVRAAAGIALENERLQAELRARLEELRGSRQRVIEAGDTERKRLERNLHDGAQQRLVTLSLELAMLEARLAKDPEAKAGLEQARRELASSLEELRELARGIHPAVLTQHGLAPALDSLAARMPFAVQLDARLEGRLPEHVETAAYYLVAESLANCAKYANASEAKVQVALAGNRVTVEVVDDGCGGAAIDGGSGLRGLADRIEAVDGELEVISPAGAGTRVRAEIPLS